MSNIVIIFAAGHGVRMKSSMPKQFIEIKQKPILAHTIDVFESSSLIDKILVVTLKDKIKFAKKLIKKYKYNKVIDVIPGGTTAFKSQFYGIEYLKNQKIKENDIILIHDGVRPLINDSTIKKAISLTKNKGNAITVNKATETISVNYKNNLIKDIEPRESCFVIRAPQCFRFKDIYNAHKKAKKQGLAFVDSASLMKYYGHKLYTFVGPFENIKVTTENDFVVCKYFIERKQNGK